MTLTLYIYITTNMSNRLYNTLYNRYRVHKNNFLYVKQGIESNLCKSEEQKSNALEV
jgi:hypothetical protein